MVVVRSVENPPADSSSHRTTRSSTRKRNADHIAESDGGEDVSRGSPDSNPQEGPADAESTTLQNTKERKKPRISAPANSQASWKKDLQGRLRRLDFEKKKLEKSLKNVTRESVLNARRGAKEVWDQARINMEFKNLKRDIRNWVKKYGTTKKILTFSYAIKNDILSACTLDQYRKVFSKDDFSAIQELPKGAQLLLEGFLYAESIYYLINRPFLFVDAVLQEHSRPNGTILAFGNYESLFEEFAQTLAECDAFPDQAQRWTASVLQSLKRMIIPDPSDESASHLKIEKLSSDPFRIYELGISQLASEFLYHSKPVRCLLGDVEKKENKPRYDDLKNIHRKFREMAYHMWCQPSTVYHCYELGRFDPSFMELDSMATNGRQDIMDIDKLKGSKVLIRLCPKIWGEIIDPINDKERQKVVHLTQKVWTVDCQTHGQWKASQSDSPGAKSEYTSQTSPKSDVPTGSQEVMTGSVSVDNQSFNTAPAQVFENTGYTTSSLSDANSDIGPGLSGAYEHIQITVPEIEAEIPHSRGVPDTNDVTKHNDLDAMEEI